MIADELTSISSTSELRSAETLATKSTNDDALPDSSNVESLDNVVLGLDGKVDSHVSVTSNSDPPDSGVSTVVASELNVTQPSDGVTDTALKESVLHESIACTLHRFVLPLIALFVNVFSFWPTNVNKNCNHALRQKVSGCLSAAFVHSSISSGQILLPRYLVNG